MSNNTETITPEVENLIQNTISNPKRGRPKKIPKPKVRNEQGQQLTKKGTIDKRAEQSKLNLQKSSIYQAIQAAKKKKLNKEIEPDDASDNSDEYEFELTEKKTAERPKDIAVTQVVNPDIDLLRQENEKLKKSFQFNDHLNRLNSLSRNMSVRF